MYQLSGLPSRLMCFALGNEERGYSLNCFFTWTKASNSIRLSGTRLCPRPCYVAVPVLTKTFFFIILAVASVLEARLDTRRGITEEQNVSPSLTLAMERRGRLPLSSSSLTVSDGYQFVAALLNPSIDLIKFAAPVVDVPVDAWIIPGIELPIIITRNITTEGNEDGWPLLRLHNVREKMRLEGNVTWTIRFVFLHGAFGDNVYRSQGLTILSPTAPNQTSEMLLGPAAVSFRLCFQAPKYQALTLVDRPTRYPGNQTVRLDVPMTGCLDGPSVPPLLRCWASKAIMVDIAGQGVMINPASDLPVSTNIWFWMRNVTGFCEHAVDANCLAKPISEPLICYKEAEQRHQNDTDFLDDYRPQWGQSGGTQSASVPQQSAVIPTSGGGRHRKAVVGVVAGAVVASVLVAAVMAAVVTVLWRRRKRRHTDSHSVIISESTLKSTFGWRMSSPAFNNAPCPDMCPSPGAGGAGLNSIFSMGLPQLFNTDRDLSAHQSQDKSILQTVLVTAEGDPVTPNTEPKPDLDLHVRLRDANSAPTSRTEIKGSAANNNGHKPDFGTVSAGSDSADGSGQKEFPAASGTNGRQQVENDAEGDAGPQTAVTNYNNSFLAAVSCHTISAGLEVASGDGGSGGSGVVELSQVVRGKGAFGRVMEGTFNGERVAVKLLACDWAWGEPTETFTRCFAQELEVLSRCQHPNVVRLLAACVDAPRLCLVLELMETSLDRVIYGDPTAPLMPLPKVLHIAISVAAALAYLHPTIIHRDLKPANVLINDPQSDRPVVKLTDFGLARLRVTVMPTEHPDAGTPAYMAPECFDVQDNLVTHKADIFSLGVLLWEMLMCKRPWEGLANPLAVALMVAYSDARLSLSDLGEDRCPPKLARLIEACWERDPARRPAAAEVAKHLALMQQQIQLQPL
ncbi:hypothetical protein VaNZ11_015111 [Volvox africanus]|uniref:Protein kinase domain-containing protein n=1 Tax=Volvox africanus TaxID=51714 RepID=A0ABQ5SJU5_9CHLO|nr:hypothetical protein VaNZ11_015111 [Volvox africanus]